MTASRLVLLLNAGVALLTSGVSLMLLLIAPLGLATVIGLTLWIALCSLVGGLAADVLLLRLLPDRRGTDPIHSAPKVKGLALDGNRNRSLRPHL